LPAFRKLYTGCNYKVEEEATNSSLGLVVANSMASLSRKRPLAVQLIISLSDLLIGKSFTSKIHTELVTEPLSVISV
jgi:hypothetical protein